MALRGHSERIGVKVGNYIPHDELGYEEYNWPDFIKTQQGRRFPLRLFLEGKSDWHKLIPCGEHNVSASEIHNYRQNKTGDGLLLNENGRGERFAIFAFSQQSRRNLMENRLRADQVRHALEWIARKSLPFTVSSQKPYLWPIVNRTVDGKWVVGIINLSTERVETIPAILNEDVTADELMLLNDDGELSPIKGRIIRQNDKRAIYEIPCSLEPLEFMVLILGSAV